MIIDANAAGLVCQQAVCREAAPVLAWIGEGGRVIYGGKLTKELTKSRAVERWLVGLTRAGQATLIAKDKIEAEEKVIAESHQCVSNDIHILALARVSGARLLFSADRNLHKDFLNNDILKKPGGSIYQNEGHKHLLKKNVCRE